jgi:hypothetical protein
MMSGAWRILQLIENNARKNRQLLVGKNRRSFIDLYNFPVIMQKSVTATPKITSLIMLALQPGFSIVP